MLTNRIQWFLSHYSTLAESEVQCPEIPMEIYLHEAQLLAGQVVSDFDTLAKAGLTKKQLDSVEDLVIVCRETQKLWAGSFRPYETVNKEWSASYKSAQSFCQLLVNVLSHAFRDMPWLKEQVPTAATETPTGRTLADRLEHLARLATENIPALADYDLNPSGLNHALVLAGRLIYLLDGNGRSVHTGIEKSDLRNQSYTRLMQACGHILETAKKAFADKPDKVDDYNRIFASQPTLLIIAEE